MLFRSLLFSFLDWRYFYGYGSAELTDDQDEIEGVAMLTGVSRQLMENLFDRAESENGSMLEFLKAKLNITDDEIATLRSKYLEPAE